MLDRVFGALPAQPELKPVATVAPQGLGRRIVIKLDVPQAVVAFGGYPAVAPVLAARTSRMTSVAPWERYQSKTALHRARPRPAR